MIAVSISASSRLFARRDANSASMSVSSASAARKSSAGTARSISRAWRSGIRQPLLSAMSADYSLAFLACMARSCKHSNSTAADKRQKSSTKAQYYLTKPLQHHALTVIGTTHMSSAFVRSSGIKAVRACVPKAVAGEGLGTSCWHRCKVSCSAQS